MDFIKKDFKILIVNLEETGFKNQGKDRALGSSTFHTSDR